MDGLQLIRSQAIQDKNINLVAGEVTDARTNTDLINYNNLKERLDTMDNNLASAINGLEWKPSVPTFDKIATAYPNPEGGWTVSVDDTNKIYRYDEKTQKWTLIISSFENATDTHPGLMSTEDKKKLDALNVGGYVNNSGDIMTGNLTMSNGGKFVGDLTGNSDTSTKLKTPRKINGVNFDGSTDITVADNTKLPLTGGTLTGALYLNNNMPLASKTTGGSNWSLVQLNDENKVVLGAYLPLVLRSNVNPVVKINNVDRTLYHTGNKPTPAEIGAIGFNYNGNDEYARLIPPKAEWIRVGESTGTGGLLPYSNGNSYLGTKSWNFKEIHGATLFENGTPLASKYLSLTGGKMLNSIIMGNNIGYQGDDAAGNARDLVRLNPNNQLVLGWNGMQNAPRIYKGTTAYEIYHKGNKPTPVEIGALPTSGGTMTGDLILNKQRLLGDNGATILRDHGNGNVTLSAGINAAGVAGSLYLGYNAGTFHKTADVRLESPLNWKGTKTLVDSNGNIPWSTITGKPTSTEIGALPTSGGTMTGDLILNKQRLMGANDTAILRDHGNGNVSLSAGKNSDGVVGNLYLGYNPGASYVTKNVQLESPLTWRGQKSLVDSNGNIPWSTITGKPTPAEMGAIPSTGGTMTGTINNTMRTGTWLEGNRGKALLNSNGAAGDFTTLIKSNSTNGYFTLNNANTEFVLAYTNKATVDAGTNTISRKLSLLNEAGNSMFPGNVTANGGFTGSLSGNATTATRLQVAKSITLTGDITGTVNFDGSTNVSMTTKVVNAGVSIKLNRLNNSVTLNAPATTVQIGIAGYDTARDILNVYLSGVRLRPGVDYTSTATSITGTNGVSFVSGDVISFEVIKAIVN